MSGKIEKNEAGVGTTQTEDNTYKGYFQVDYQDLKTILNTDYVGRKVQVMNVNTEVSQTIRSMCSSKNEETGRMQYLIEPDAVVWLHNIVRAGIITEEEIPEIKFGFISDTYSKNGKPKTESPRKLVYFASGLIVARIRGTDYLVARKNQKFGVPASTKWFEDDQFTHEMSENDWFNIGYDDDFAEEYKMPEWKVPEDRTIWHHYDMQYCTMVAFNNRGTHSRVSMPLLDIFTNYLALAKPSKEVSEGQKFIERMSIPGETASATELESARAIEAPRMTSPVQQVTKDLNDILNKVRQ